MTSRATGVLRERAQRAAAKSDGVATERACVVAHLRSRRFSSPAAAFEVELLAAAIERGDHATKPCV
jgi:hypothetical protein